jgi:hypothetical protein
MLSSGLPEGQFVEDRLDQRARVVVPRRAEYLGDRAGLDDAALAHDGDAVAQVGHHAQVVRDQQDTEATFALSRRSRARISACTVTSRAVVGSSAISSRGSPAMAAAIRTRWAMPPEIWCG